MNIKDFILKLSYLNEDGSENTVVINDGLYSFGEDVGAEGELLFM